MSGLEILFGIVLPGFVFAVSLGLTILLYRRFSKPDDSRD